MKENGNFLLYPGLEPGNKTNRIITFLVDWFFIWLYLSGMAVWLISALDLPVAVSLCLGIQAVAALGIQLLTGSRGRRAGLKMLLWCAALAVFALLFRDFWSSGIHIICNRGVEALGERFPYLFPAYAVTVGEEMREAALYGALFWLSALAAVPAVYLVRAGNRILLGIQAVALLAAQMVTGIGPGLAAGVWSALCLLAVWIRGHGERIPAGRQRLAALESFLFAGVGIFLLMAGGRALTQRFLPENAELFTGIRSGVLKSLEEFRYQGDSQVLPDGDFTGLGSFEPTEDPVLEITMSRPDSYYLRGFTGSVYTGNGWTGPEAAVLWENRNLFYWLHQENFYGQEILPGAALALDASVASEEKNAISVKNLSGNSKYCYVPYELHSLEESPVRQAMDRQKIGDAAVVSQGLYGNREYSYEALANQVTKYPALNAALLDTDSLGEEGENYRELEGFYNEFAYSVYLDIPDRLNASLSEVLGVKEIDSGEKHADYAEAKQNILYALTAGYTDTNILENTWDGSDFIFDFLNVSKKGYSVHFASAAVMMFRYYGIPARYVEGYLITPDDVSAMTEGESYVLDETHAHAWVEYYQDGVGWLPFETTPSYLNTMDRADEYQDISGMDGAGSQDQTDQEEEEPEKEEEEQKAPEFDWIFLLTVLMILGILLLVLVMIIFLIWILVQRRKSRKAKRLFQSADRREAARALFEYSMNLMSVAGLKIRNTSLYRYEKAIEKMFDREMAEEYIDVVAVRQEAVYSGHEITEEQWSLMRRFKEKIWNRIYSQGSILQKFQLKYIYFL